VSRDPGHVVRSEAPALWHDDDLIGETSQFVGFSNHLREQPAVRHIPSDRHQRTRRSNRSQVSIEGVVRPFNVEETEPIKPPYISEVRVPRSWQPTESNSDGQHRLAVSDKLQDFARTLYHHGDGD
jgi:hypothetical protein